MRAGIIARSWCELLQVKNTRTETGGVQATYESIAKVRCYEVKSRPYTYWQEKRASERFVDWQVELLFRTEPTHPLDQIKVRYNGKLYRVMWYDVDRGQTRLLLRMDNE